MVHRAVLAGCGAMSRGWVRALRETPDLAARVEIVGLVDIQPGAAEALRQEFDLDGAETGTDLAGVLAGTGANLLFDVAVPSGRRDLVATGFAHGCHVLTEKPMAATLEQAREIVALAAEAGRIHAVVQNRRYNEGVRRIRATLAAGAIGELTGIHCDFFVGAHFGGFREEMQNVLLVDMAIHTLDAARFMSGKMPLAVYCHQTNPRGSWYAHGSAANAIFEFSDDVVFTYRGSWSAEGANTSWDSSWRLIGTKGTLQWDGEEAITIGVVAGEEGFFRPIADAPAAVADPATTQGHVSVLREFLDAVDTGRAPETAGADNIKSLAMVFAAIKSAETGQRVFIEP